MGGDVRNVGFVHWIAALVMLLQIPVVDIGPDFSDPSARASRLTSERIQVTLSVRAQPDASVVAHLIEPAGEQLTVAMADSNDGVYEGTFETRPIDLVVVFEAIGSGRTSIQSNPVRLTQIGLPPGALAPQQFPESSDDDDPLQWVWLALAAGAAALSLVALAFLPKRRSASGDDEPVPDQSGVDSVTG